MGPNCPVTAKGHVVGQGFFALVAPVKYHQTLLSSGIGKMTKILLLDKSEHFQQE
jgi:hypothetical protein